MRQQQALSREQRQALRSIAVCRTPALGGQVDVCSGCGFERPAYHSCRNRHCPKCQSLAQARWIEQRMARVVDVAYFHVVFTLPAALRAIALAQRRRVFALLMRAAAQTLLTLGHDPNRLGAELGITAVLHPWTRELEFHPHVHCIVTAGGLTEDRRRWRPARRRHLFPVKVLGALFRGKGLAGLQQDLARGALSSSDPVATRRTIGALHLRRLLVHVLPIGFVTIRHSGLFASRQVSTSLPFAQQLLAKRAPIERRDTPSNCAALLQRLTGIDITRCPRCEHSPLDRRVLSPYAGRPPP